jgi:hypothetical protein
MYVLLDRSQSFLESRLRAGPRLLLVAASLLLVAIYVFPLWRLTMFAPQYPEGLRARSTC